MAVCVEVEENPVSSCDWDGMEWENGTRIGW